MNPLLTAPTSVADEGLDYLSINVLQIRKLRQLFTHTSNLE